MGDSGQLENAILYSYHCSGDGTTNLSIFRECKHLLPSLCFTKEFLDIFLICIHDHISLTLTPQTPLEIVSDAKRSFFEGGES